MKLSCLIIDDEPAARNGLAEDIKEIDYLEITGMAANAFEALELISKYAPALLFLDIEMPGLNGLDFLNLLKIKPMVILTTAYPQYALDSYELGVIDYLLKPILIERLKIACNKAVELFSYRFNNAVSQHQPAYFYIKSNGKMEKINFSDILYIEAANNYVFIHTANKKIISYNTLKGMECQLPKDKFIKVHKSFIVSKVHIQQVLKNEVLVNGKNIPVSKNFRSEFQKVVIMKNFLKR